MHTGKQQAEIMADDDQDVFHESFNDPLEVRKAEAESMEAELVALEVEERLVRLKLEIKKKKDSISSLTANTSQFNPASQSGKQSQSAHQSTPAEQTVKPTLKSLASNQELNAAIDVLKEAHLADLLTEVEDTAAVLQDLQDVPTNEKGKSSTNDKILYITDFVIKPKQSGRDSDKQIAQNLWVRLNKLKVEEVTVPQWLSANARILIHMLDTLDKDTVRKYLRYTAKVGDYLQVSETPSVMLFDEEHRCQVAREGQTWDVIDGDTRYFFLEKEKETDEASSQQSKSKQPQSRRKQRGPVDDSGNPICLSYNKEQGCSRSWCTYSHICSVQGCNASHPKHLHSTPPRFRNQRQD